MLIFMMMINFSLASFGQDFNKVIFDEKAQREIIQGYCDEEGLKTTVWKDFYDQTYHEYMPQMEILFQLMPQMQNIEIVVTIGTWCGDSKEQVPAFLRILKELQYDMSKLIIIGLDRNFDSGIEGIRPYDTEKVPTFIFFRNGIEAGRIIETPEGSLEQHMAVIVGL